AGHMGARLKTLLAVRKKINQAPACSGVCRPGDWNRIPRCNCKQACLDQAATGPTAKREGFGKAPGALEAVSSPPVKARHLAGCTAPAPNNQRETRSILCPRAEL